MNILSVYLNSQQFGVELFLDVYMNIALSMFYHHQYYFHALSSQIHVLLNIKLPL